MSRGERKGYFLDDFPEPFNAPIKIEPGVVVLQPSPFQNSLHDNLP